MRVGFVIGEFCARVCERVRVDNGEQFSERICELEEEEEEVEEQDFRLAGCVSTTAGEGWVAVTSA